MAQDAYVKIQKSTNGGVTRDEIGNLFENLKTDLLNTISAQLTKTQVKRHRMKLIRPLSCYFQNIKTNIP